MDDNLKSKIILGKLWPLKDLKRLMLNLKYEKAISTKLSRIWKLERLFLVPVTAGVKETNHVLQ